MQWPQWILFNLAFESKCSCRLHCGLSHGLYTWLKVFCWLTLVGLGWLKCNWPWEMAALNPFGIVGWREFWAVIPSILLLVLCRYSFKSYAPSDLKKRTKCPCTYLIYLDETELQARFLVTSPPHLSCVVCVCVCVYVCSITLLSDLLSDCENGVLLLRTAESADFEHVQLICKASECRSPVVWLPCGFPPKYLMKTNKQNNNKK